MRNKKWRVEWAVRKSITVDAESYQDAIVQAMSATDDKIDEGMPEGLQAAPE